MAPTKLRPINSDLRQIAQVELNEIETRIESDIGALRVWLAKQPHLRSREDEQFLVAFLRGCKYSLEKAKSKIDHFYTIKTMMPELFAKNVMDEKNIALCRSGTYVSLPKPLGPGGPRIQLSKYSKFDSKLYKLIDLFRYQTLLMEHQIQQDDNCIISGYIEIVDMSNMSLSFLTHLDFPLIKRLGVFAEKGAPMRIKGVHLVNFPKEAVAVINLAKSLMPSKLQKRFFVYKNIEELYATIPRENLPEEYGGSNGRIAEIQAETEKVLLSYDPYFRENDQYGVNEQLRPGKHISADELFGIEGSFRKLDID
ncbi:alpha-tocopherol transfer protein-like [Scaptodrosophila lebanonensis]|uniref:Alpha-tocopherol transfer protein-like n=1 Tax=Drosophila lebanonensis TaxID=7225 RepID=A0A6J2UF57_DROLE|nr:alpha-tocopherol transfer protein-like [Scaptodrosophila lebanonensis]